MANNLYAKGKEELLAGNIDLPADEIRAVLVSSTYALAAAAHKFYSDISTHVLGDAVTLAGKSITNGVFDADDPVWIAPSSGSTAKAVVLYKWTGVASTSPLLAYIDTITGFPLLLQGANLMVRWDDGTFKIFSL